MTDEVIVADDEIDSKSHNKLLKKYTRLKANANVRREFGPVQEVLGGNDKDGALSLNTLTSSSKLTEKLDSKSLKPQPTTETARAAEREVNFGQLSEKVTEWEPIVIRNQLSSKLSFPLDREPLSYHATSRDLKKRAATNPSSLEQQVYAALKAASSSIPSEETGLTEKETSKLEKMDYKEALDRLHELRKHRILTARQLERFKREKSIKSKKFNRLKTQYKMEKMKTNLDAKGLSSILRDRRIEERVTLRHRKTGKWDRKLEKYAKHDKATRDQLENKRMLNKKLTTKVEEGKSSSEGEESDEDWEMVAPKRKRVTGIIEKEEDRELVEQQMEQSGSDSSDDDAVKREKFTYYKKDFRDEGEIILSTGDPGKMKLERKFGDGILIDPSEYMSTTVVDKPLLTSVNSEAIEEAFEDDEDLMEALEDDTEDKEKIEAFNIKENGWGSWTGPGIEKKTEKFQQKSFKKPKKKTLGYVVFNDVPNEQLAEHQVRPNRVPRHFNGNRSKFEASLQGAIGPDFNTAASFRRLIEPRVNKKVGVPIAPISKDTEKKDDNDVTGL